MERISDRLKALVAHQEELDRKIQEQHQQLLADLNEHLAQECQRRQSFCSRDCDE